MTALSVFCIIAARLPSQPVVHHRVSGYRHFVFHPFSFLTPKREKTRDTKFMLRIVFHNKTKKKKGVWPVGATLVCSWEKESRWHGPRRDVCSSLGCCVTSFWPQTHQILKWPRAPSLLNSKGLQGKQITAPANIWQSVSKPSSAAGNDLKMCSIRQKGTEISYKTFLFSPARETCCFQSCVRLNKKH